MTSPMVLPWEKMQYLLAKLFSSVIRCWIGQKSYSFLQYLVYLKRCLGSLKPQCVTSRSKIRTKMGSTACWKRCPVLNLLQNSTCSCKAFPPLFVFLNTKQSEAIAAPVQ